MNYTVITLFPDMLESLNHGVVGKALENDCISLECINPRDFTEDSYQTVDDAPYGGGPGMVMKAEPLLKAVQAAKEKQANAKVIYVSPQGKQFDQKAAKQLATSENLVFIAGRYEGIDQRVIDEVVDEEWSIGDYVISGGELAAMVMIDAITRMISGVVGDKESVESDTFYKGLLKHPQYTRPEEIAGKRVPEVLLSGNHAAIDEWREKHSLGNTWLKRPDLLDKIALTEKQALLLKEIKRHRS